MPSAQKKTTGASTASGGRTFRGQTFLKEPLRAGTLKLHRTQNLLETIPGLRIPSVAERSPRKAHPPQEDKKMRNANFFYPYFVSLILLNLDDYGLGDKFFFLLVVEVEVAVGVIVVVPVGEGVGGISCDVEGGEFDEVGGNFFEVVVVEVEVVGGSSCAHVFFCV